jgi:hypothetical protein
MLTTSRGLILWDSPNDQFNHTYLQQNFQTIDTLLGGVMPLKAMFPYWIDGPNEALPSGYAYCTGQTLNSTQQDINPGGNYTVPDMRNVFVLGADPAKATGQGPVAVGDANIDNPAGSPGAKATGGSNQHVTTLAQMPQHNHTASTTSPTITVTIPAHTHTVTDNGHTHGVNDSGHTHPGSTLTGGAHSHTITDPGHRHSAAVAGSNAFPEGNIPNEQDASAGQTGTSTTGISIDGSTGAHTHTVTIANAPTGVTLNSASTGISIGSAGASGTATLSGLNVNLNPSGSDQPHNNRPSFIGLVWIMKVKST